MTAAKPSDPRRLVLASGSPRRRELLSALGLPIEVRPVDIDETPFEGEVADVYVSRLAESKARERGSAGELILAADTVVAIDGELLGKPVDREHARAMLRRLSNQSHQVHTGVAVWDPAEDLLHAELSTTRVIFAELGEPEIEWYVESGEPMDKAGAYGIQGLAALFVESIEGNYSNVVGLPLPTVRRLLGRHGYPIVG